MSHGGAGTSHKQMAGAELRMWQDEAKSPVTPPGPEGTASLPTGEAEGQWSLGDNAPCT